MGFLKSATKIVFLMLTCTACIGFITGIFPVKDFKDLCLMAFSFYFAIKQVAKPEEV